MAEEQEKPQPDRKEEIRNKGTSQVAYAPIPEAPGLKPIEDSDVDSLFILPLSLIPLQTPALHRARLIKNVRLNSVIEIFSSKATGSGQINIEHLPKMFGWPKDSVHPDLAVLRSLSRLPSYDVYSLRISLRGLGIKVNDHEALKLSPDKNKQLTKYMTLFTRPLMQLIYSDEDVNIETFDDIIRLFRDPDVRKAKKRLETMAHSLGIDVQDVPRFLEDYGDTFLSLSYFRHCLDRLVPYVTACLDSMDTIRKHFQLRQDPNLMRTCDMIEGVLNEVSASVTGKFEVFDKRTKEMWKHISAEQFREIKEMVERYHTTIGGVLCGLTVKMNAWAKIFPKPNSGGPQKKADFMMSEMSQGIENITRIERQGY